VYPIRKRYFINPRLQLQLVLGANILALISAGLILTLNFYTHAHLENYVSSLGSPPGAGLSSFLAERQADFDRVCLAIGLAQFVLFNLTAIFLSQRIAGPLYRLERHLDAIAAGSEAGDVRFRRGDFYQSLAEACNKVLAELRACRASRPSAG
jgi:methyl-accepting chemotaxis protein